MNIKIKLLNKKLGEVYPLPHYSTPGSVGMDLRAMVEERVELHPNQTYLVSTGFALDFEGSNMAGFIYPRSGLGSKHGIILANGTGVIDEDYTGEIKVALWNRGNEVFYINEGDRIAQLVFVPVVRPTLMITNELSETVRGSGGFGSTGINDISGSEYH